MGNTVSRLAAKWFTLSSWSNNCTYLQHEYSRTLGKDARQDRHAVRGIHPPRINLGDGADGLRGAGDDLCEYRPAHQLRAHSAYPDQHQRRRLAARAQPAPLDQRRADVVVLFPGRPGDQARDHRRPAFRYTPGDTADHRGHRRHGGSGAVLFHAQRRRAGRQGLGDSHGHGYCLRRGRPGHARQPGTEKPADLPGRTRNCR